MIIIAHRDTSVVLLPDARDIDDLHAMLSLKQYPCTYSQAIRPAIWIPDSYVFKLNEDLIEFKDIISIDKSFADWKKTSNTKPPVQIKCGVINSKIYKGGYELPHKAIEAVCRYFFKPAVRQQRYIDKKWDGYVHLYKKWLHEFPTGLLEDVCQVLKDHDIPFNVTYLYNQRPQREFDWDIDDGIVPTEDQLEAIRAAICSQRCQIKCPTAFGKSAVVAKRLIATLGVPTLFIASRKQLLTDAANDFAIGVKGLDSSMITQIKDGWFGNVKINSSMDRNDIPPIDTNKTPIIVSTVQSLKSRLSDERTNRQAIDLLRNKIKLVILDECQTYNNGIFKTVFDETYAPYRIFLSATPQQLGASA